MKHKHYEMIVAKAANMDLVVFYQLEGEEWWSADSHNHALPCDETVKYFLCLPKHKEACLHWLNGGEALIERDSFNNDGDKLPSEGFLNWDRPSREWRPEVSFMSCNCKFKIKPKKEKRWIVWDTAKRVPEEYSYESLEVARLEFDYPDAQFIEIEVEV